MKENLSEIIALYGDNIPVSDFTETVKTVKEKLKNAKDKGREVRVTLCSFGKGGEDGACYKKLHDNIPADKLPSKKLFSTDDSYEIALIDSAMGLTEELGERYRNTPEDEIPERIIFVIIVFGRDNASRKFTYDDLKGVIEHQSEIYKWEFYLIADTPDIREKLGVTEENTIITSTDTEGFYKRAIEELGGLIESRR